MGEEVVIRQNYQNTFLYQDYDQDWCPICGGKIVHPLTGEVSSEDLEEDSKYCHWIEVQDENDNTLGYHAICNNIHPYTLAKDDHKYVYYDMLEIVNTDTNLDLGQKIELYTKMLLRSNPNLTRDDVYIVCQGDKIVEVNASKPIDHMSLNITLTDDDHMRLEFSKDDIVEVPLKDSEE